MNLEKIKEKLEDSLSPKRFIHSINVMNSSIYLAKKYDEDIRLAAIAGLLHDCARDIRGKDIFDICEKYNIKVDDISSLQTELLHGPIGSILARREYGIEDKPVLNAICNHTLGCENMSKLDKIIFLADYIEPGRKFKGVEKIRKMAEINLDKAVLLSYDNTFRYCIKKGCLIHPKAIFARNQILKEMGHTSARSIPQG